VKTPVALTVMVWVVAPLLHSQLAPADAVRSTEPPAQNVVAPLGVIVATGNGLTVTLIGADVAEHPKPFVTVTVKTPVALTVMVWVVEPLLHSQLAPADAVRSTEPPAQKIVGPPGVIVATGNGLTVTLVEFDVAEQPKPFVTVTVKTPVVLTVMVWVVAPLLHSQLAPADAVRSTEPPAQKVVGPLGVIVATGNGLTVTLVGADVAEHPSDVTVTVKTPVALTVMVWVVAPLLHSQLVPADAVRSTEPPAQNVVGPLGVMVATGKGFSIMTALPFIRTAPTFTVYVPAVWLPNVMGLPSPITVIIEVAPPFR